MSKYIVRVYVSSFYDVEVEADNQEEAKEIAEDSRNRDMELIQANMVTNEDESQVLDEYDNTVRRIKPDWDSDGADDLPEVVEIPGYVDDDDVADYISDIYGFLMFSWEEVK